VAWGLRAARCAARVRRCDTYPAPPSSSRTASSTFVPTDSMPAAVQAFAQVNPITLCSDAVRALTIGGDATTAVLGTTAWFAGLMLLFVPLAIGRYRALR
jgi:ABC-type polysaccharide/polyol phosphate export permease